MIKFTIFTLHCISIFVVSDNLHRLSTSNEATINLHIVLGCRARDLQSFIEFGTPL
jgi:hypothetical protein